MHTTPTPRAAVRRRRSLLTAVVAAVVASLVLVPSAAQAEQSVPAQNAGRLPAALPGRARITTSTPSSMGRSSPTTDSRSTG